MHTKLTTACVSLLALAAMMLAPAAASASPVVTENGVRVPATNPDGVNTILRGTNVGETLFTTGLGNVKCTKSVLEGELLKNTGTEFTATLSKFEFHGDDPVEEKCTSTISDFQGGTLTATVEVETPAFCLHSVSGVDHVLIYGEKAGGSCEKEADRVTIGFNLIMTTHTGGSFATCTYQRSTSEPITASYTTGSDTITSSEQNFTKSSGPFTCPSTGKFDATYTVETTNGTAVTVS